MKDEKYEKLLHDGWSYRKYSGGGGGGDLDKYGVITSPGVYNANVTSNDSVEVEEVE